MENEHSLWMGDIDETLTEQKILDAFRAYSVSPKGVKFLFDKENKRYKSYCFIIFNTYHQALMSLNKLNGKNILNTNKTFKLNWANNTQANYLCIYVGHISPTTKDEELYELFKKKYKSTHTACIIRDGVNKKASKGYGFVTFMDEKDYSKACSEMNGVEFNGYTMIVKPQRKKDDINNFNIDNINNNTNNGVNNNINNNNNINIVNNNIDNREILGKYMPMNWIPPNNEYINQNQLNQVTDNNNIDFLKVPYTQNHMPFLNNMNINLIPYNQKIIDPNSITYTPFAATIINNNNFNLNFGNFVGKTNQKKNKSSKKQKKNHPNNNHTDNNKHIENIRNIDYNENMRNLEIREKMNITNNIDIYNPNNNTYNINIYRDLEQRKDHNIDYDKYGKLYEKGYQNVYKNECIKDIIDINDIRNENNEKQHKINIRNNIDFLRNMRNIIKRNLQLCSLMDEETLNNEICSEIKNLNEYYIKERIPGSNMLMYFISINVINRN